MRALRRLDPAFAALALVLVATACGDNEVLPSAAPGVGADVVVGVPGAVGPFPIEDAPVGSRVGWLTSVSFDSGPTAVEHFRSIVDRLEDREFELRPTFRDACFQLWQRDEVRGPDDPFGDEFQGRQRLGEKLPPTGRIWRRGCEVTAAARSGSLTVNLIGADPERPLPASVTIRYRSDSPPKSYAASTEPPGGFTVDAGPSTAESFHSFVDLQAGDVRGPNVAGHCRSFAVTTQKSPYDAVRGYADAHAHGGRVNARRLRFHGRDAAFASVQVPAGGPLLEFGAVAQDDGRSELLVSAC